MGIAEPFYSMERAVLRRARRSGRAGAAPRIPAPSHQETDPREARGRSTDRSVERAPSPSPDPDRPAGLHFFFFFFGKCGRGSAAAPASDPPRRFPHRAAEIAVRAHEMLARPKVVSSHSESLWRVFAREADRVVRSH